jgi:hypothetical protein
MGNLIGNELAFGRERQLRKIAWQLEGFKPYARAIPFARVKAIWPVNADKQPLEPLPLQHGKRAAIDAFRRWNVQLPGHDLGLER